VLTARHLVKRYGPRTVVDGLTLQVERGEIIGLLGPNGAGKTTTFYMMVGLVRPNAGEVWLDDKNLTRFPVHRRARLGIGYLAQEPSVFRGLTVEENILMVLEANGKPPRVRRETMAPPVGGLALRRRAAARGDRPRPGHGAVLHAAG